MTPENLTKQLDGLISEWSDFRSRSGHDDCSDVMSETKAIEIATRACAAIERIGGKHSAYHVSAEEIRSDQVYWQLKVLRVVGVLQSLSADLKAGYLRTLEELIHGEVFGDFLEMAQHLVDSGYKDAAAVISGSSLEAHLRHLAKRFGVPIEKVTSKGTEPLKADLINADLMKAGAYSGLDQKNVTAWLGLRNKAAHGQYADYQKDQVVLMIDAVRNFISRHPA